ncbi:Hypothetical predicted protein [Paramuricea clavata]|uniref:Uncharacterized protein n=1 Tax=Paramuricea clavata TaxID=317549 RepID=A0A6S7I0Q7_PARCT|nr:Hypothetical predicted protein [Paramuricea clavata]
MGSVSIDYETRDDWTAYIERVEQYFLANNVADDKRVPVLLIVIGGNWLGKITLDWKAINTLATTPPGNPSTRLQEILEKYGDVFEEDIDLLKTTKAKLNLKENSQPKFCKARQVPYALRPKVEVELTKLQNDGILTKVDWSERATLVVPVIKKNGNVRLCGDFKQTINPVLHVQQYPLPRIDAIFASLGGGQKFSKIDL